MKLLLLFQFEIVGMRPFWLTFPCSHAYHQVLVAMVHHDTMASYQASEPKCAHTLGKGKDGMFSLMSSGDVLPTNPNEVLASIMKVCQTDVAPLLAKKVAEESENNLSSVTGDIVGIFLLHVICSVVVD